MSRTGSEKYEVANLGILSQEEMRGGCIAARPKTMFAVCVASVISLSVLLRAVARGHSNR